MLRAMHHSHGLACFLSPMRAYGVIVSLHTNLVGQLLVVLVEYFLVLHVGCSPVTLFDLGQITKKYGKQVVATNEGNTAEDSVQPVNALNQRMLAYAHQQVMTRVKQGRASCLTPSVVGRTPSFPIFACAGTALCVTSLRKCDRCLRPRSHRATSCLRLFVSEM